LIFLSTLFAAAASVACSDDTGSGAQAAGGSAGNVGSGGASGGSGTGGSSSTGGTSGESGGSSGGTGTGGAGTEDSGAGSLDDAGNSDAAIDNGGSEAGSDFTLGSGNPSSMGLDRHDGLYCGEWQRTTKPGDTIYLIKGGKVVWTHSLHTSGGDEFGDCTMLSNGHVVYNLKNTGAQEMVPNLQTGSEGDIAWRYNQDGGTEVHAVQPIGLDKVLVMQNGNPAKLMLINKKTAAICKSGDPCVEKTWHPDSGGQVHGMFRHVRMAANGNLIVPYTGGGAGSQGHVKEYTQDWQVVWDYDTGGSPWAAVRLKNGNTLVSGNGGKWFREVSHDMPPKVVWEMTQDDFKAAGLTTAFLAQGAIRLANGNTILGLWCGPIGNTAQWSSTDQYWEVTPAKVPVWKVRSWTAPNLGPGSYMQPLDEPGIPETPGDLQR
jgi:hypothetical protein